MKVLWKYFDGHYKQLVLGPLFKLAEAILELFVPLVMARIIDVGIKNGDIPYIFAHGALMIGLGAVGLCFAMICQYYAARCAQGFARSLRKDLFRHIFSLSQTEYGAIGTDSLITRLTNDTNQVQNGINMFIRLGVRAPFLIIGSIIMALSINVKIGLIFLISTPIIIVVLYLIMSRTMPYYTKIQKQQDKIACLAGENLAGTRIIRAFSKQKSEIAQFGEAGDEMSRIIIFAGKISAALHPLTTVIVNLAIVAIVWFGGLYADTGALGQGEIIALVNYMNQTLLALIVLANVIVIFTKAIASGRRVSEVLAQTSSMPDVAVAKSQPESENAIAFNDVFFTYPSGGEAALEHISFALKKGQTLGIIGGTGCGKTTLAALIARDYDVSAGAVCVCGADVRELPLADLRANLGIVPQTAQLFKGTIRSNLQLGAQGATDAALWHALEIAQGAEFVQNISEGLDKKVEESGKNLSGGQKQRLTIARALAKKPKILILDDSASALDYATDAALRHALKTNTDAMTVLIISQRASGIKNSDAILVLDDGNQAGFGTHDHLLATCDVYREICTSQGIVSAASTEVGA